MQDWVEVRELVVGVQKEEATNSDLNGAVRLLLPAGQEPRPRLLAAH
jgi:hypothetical protein